MRKFLRSAVQQLAHGALVPTALGVQPRAEINAERVLCNLLPIKAMRHLRALSQILATNGSGRRSMTQFPIAALERAIPSEFEE